MKKQIFAGIVVLLVMFFVTCDDFIPFGPTEEKVEYTDVEYSEDGSTITVYLDGKGVPVTKAQRAITRDLAKMAYDYFEVVFVGKASASQIVARAQWELGQSAGISGVERDVDYEWDASKPYAAGATAEVALMFVGRKDDKTLLGVGQIAEVDHSAKTKPESWDDYYDDGFGVVTVPWVPNTNSSGSLPSLVYAYISSNSTSITFYVEAIKTGLLVDDETIDVTPPISTTNKYGILTDSFDFTAGSATGYTDRIGHSKRQNPGNGNTEYPIYSLPEKVNSVQFATYEFKGAADANGTDISFANGIKYAAAPVVTGPKAGDGIAIEKKVSALSCRRTVFAVKRKC